MLWAVVLFLVTNVGALLTNYLTTVFVTPVQTARLHRGQPGGGSGRGDHRLRQGRQLSEPAAQTSPPPTSSHTPVSNIPASNTLASNTPVSNTLASQLRRRTPGSLITPRPARPIRRPIKARPIRGRPAACQAPQERPYRFRC